MHGCVKSKPSKKSSRFIFASLSQVTFPYCLAARRTTYPFEHMFETAPCQQKFAADKARAAGLAHASRKTARPGLLLITA
jgi:hypothetical protein